MQCRRLSPQIGGGLGTKGIFVVVVVDVVVDGVVVLVVVDVVVGGVLVLVVPAVGAISS